jgi:hypothetical protein
MTREDAEKEVRSIKRTCRGSLHADVRLAVGVLLDAGDLQAARATDEANRKGCGADFNATILAGPLDGKEHEYECAKCGVRGTYRAPFYELDQQEA